MLPPSVKLWRERDSDTVHLSINYPDMRYTRIVLDELTYLSLAACVMRDMQYAVASGTVSEES